MKWRESHARTASATSHAVMTVETIPWTSRIFSPFPHTHTPPNRRACSRTYPPFSTCTCHTDGFNPGSHLLREKSRFAILRCLSSRFGDDSQKMLLADQALIVRSASRRRDNSLFSSCFEYINGSNLSHVCPCGGHFWLVVSRPSI